MPSVSPITRKKSFIDTKANNFYRKKKNSELNSSTMCNIESVNKIAKYLKVNPGKIAYNTDKIITRSTKTENLCGFTTVLSSIARESNVECAKAIATDNIKLQCLVYQWIEYAYLFVAPAAKNKHVAQSMLKEFNNHLSTRSYVVGTQLTVADLAIFFAIQQVMANLSPSEKENYINISRWYNHLQQQHLIRQGSPLINFSTLHLHSGNTGSHA